MGDTFDENYFKFLEKLWKGEVVYHKRNITVRKVENPKNWVEYAREIEQIIQSEPNNPLIKNIFGELLEDVKKTEKEWKYAVFIGDKLAGYATISVKKDEGVQIEYNGEVNKVLNEETVPRIPQDFEIIHKLVRAAEKIEKGEYPTDIENCKTLEEYRKMLLEKEED